MIMTIMIMMIMFMMILIMTIMIMVRCQRNYMLVAQGGGEGEWGGSSRDEEGSREGATLGELSMEGMMRKMIIRKMDTALRITKRKCDGYEFPGRGKTRGREGPVHTQGASSSCQEAKVEHKPQVSQDVKNQAL